MEDEAWFEEVWTETIARTIKHMTCVRTAVKTTKYQLCMRALEMLTSLARSEYVCIALPYVSLGKLKVPMHGQR